MGEFAYFRAAGNRRGYIFVDALLGMLVLLLALGALLAAYSQASTGTVVSRERTVATDLAMQTLESLKKYELTGRGRTDPVWTSPAARTETINGQTYTIRYGVVTALTTTAIEGNANIVPVQVTVTWAPNKSVQMVNYYLRQR